MFDILKKTMLTGVGIALMTKDKIEELGKKISEESKLTTEEGKKMVDELLKQSEKAKNDLESQIHKIVGKSLEKFNLPTREDINRLEKKITELENLREETDKE